MKRVTITAIFTLIAAFLFAANGFDVKYSQPRAGAHQLEYKMGKYSLSDVVLQGVNYTRIVFDGKVVTEKKGFAELPYLNATVMLDPQKNVTIGINPGEYEEISLDNPLVPSRGVIYRNQDPATAPYTIDPKSVTDSWYPVALAENSDPFILRDIRGTSVYVYPFQYNAARNVLRIYKNITVTLYENNSPAVNPLPKAPEKIVREMDAVYRSVFINYDFLNRDNLTIGEFGDIYVIVTSRDESAIEPYVQWKREKGFNVAVEVVPTGTNVNSHVQAAYNSNNDILYVLLVGDWADLTCNLSSGGRPMDPQVGSVVGDDEFADISVGRFSAASPTDVTTQVNKVIAYEKTPDMAGTWYSSAVGIASAEGAGIGDDGEADAVHESVIYNDKLDPFTYNNFIQVYDPGATATMLDNAINGGISIINYTGHGWMDGWGTTGYSSSNVAALTNGSKLPFVFSVACDVGDFDLGTSFSESWLRKQNGGAIMFLGASISQPWAEPMRGQDYFNDVLIGGYDYTAHSGQSGISTTEQRTTIGSIVFNGFTLMCTESGGSSDFETASTWNIFGDPSLQPRTATPLALNLSNELIIVGIPFTTTVSTSNGPVANAMVTLSQDGNYFTGITDASGSVTLNQSLNPGTAKLVVTAFNTGTIYQDLNVIPPSGPYITISYVNINDNDENGNGQLDYGETVYLTIGLTNVGTGDATGVNAIISSTDEFVTIGDATEDYGTIPMGETVSITSGYQVTALGNLPDLHVAMFSLDASGEAARETWSSSFVLPGHAPVLTMSAYSINDAAGNGNGRLDPGETATITVTALNSGSADAFNVAGSLAIDPSYVTVNNSPLTYGDVATGISADQAFEVTVSETAPTGYAAAFTFDLTGDMNISGNDSFVEYVGQIPVLILDWDGNHNSAPVLAQSMTDLEVGHDVMEAFPADRNLYASIFVCLGTYSDNHVMTAEEGQVLADYLNQGGNIYMEGADTWYFDQLSTPTQVHPMFNITGTEDGSNDLDTLAGQAGSIVEGMAYDYSGDNAYTDHILPVAPAVLMFNNNSPEYGAGVSFDAGTYKTVGVSFEFGGLVDGDKTKADLMIKILEFFGIQGVWTNIEEPKPVVNSGPVSYPNPFRTETAIRFETKESGRVSLEITNLNGQVINRLYDGVMDNGTHEIRWNGTDQSGDRVAEGIYFYSLQDSKGIVTGKLMLME
jgi:hypothetical protein